MNIKKKINPVVISIFIHFLFLFILLYVNPRLLFCLDPNKKINQYIHTVWTVKDGLPQNSVRSIVQTPEGYIWLGTQEGLTRFDGVRFETFNKYNNPHLKTNWTGSLYVTKDSTLWIGNYGYGIAYFHNNIWNSFSKKEGIISDIVPSFVEDQQGHLWIITNRGVLKSTFNGETWKFEHDKSLPQLTTKIIIDKTGRKWVVTNDNIYGFDSNNIRPVADLHRFIATSEYNAFLIDDFQYLWIVTNNNIIRFHLQSESITEEIKWPGVTVEGNKTIIIDKDQNLWIGTNGFGLFRYNNGKWSNITEKEGLSNNYVHSIYEDKEGNIWVGTEEGLNKFSDGFITVFSALDGLTNNSVRALCEDSSGAVWIGTMSGICKLVDNKIILPINHEIIKNRFIWTLICDSSGNVWAADVSDNVYKFLGKQIKIFKISNQFIANEIIRLKKIEVNAFHKSKNNQIMLGTQYGLFEIINDHFIEHSMLKDSIPVGSLISIFEEAYNEFYIATSSGGFIRFYNNRYFYTPVYYDSVKVIFSSYHRDNNGFIWIGSFESGLYCYDGKNWKHFTQQDGLFSNSIFAILEDNENNLWMSSNYGISKVNKKELKDFAEGKISKITAVQYGEADGMKTAECNGGAGPNGLKTRDGRLLFSTNKGVAVINPGKNYLNKQPPNVLIEKVIGDQREIKNDKMIVIEPGTKNIEILYTALSFVSPEKVNFKYRLVGLDDEWIPVGTRRIAYFNNLSPGNYIFQVVACNNSGIWNETGAKLHLYIKPFFYQTYWFYGLLIFLILMIGFIAFTLRIRSIKNRQLQLKSIIEDRTKEITLKNEQLEHQSLQLKELDQFKTRFFTNISHEFRTPLTLILGPVDDLIEREGQDHNRSYLLLIKKNARRLLKLINQLLDIAKLDSNKVDLRVACQDIVSFTRIILSSFESLLKQKNIVLEFVTSIPVIPIYLDADVYEKIIINLISNAYKFTPKNGTIIVSIQDSSFKTPDYIEIHVKDSGIGIAKEELSKIFDRFYQVENSSRSGVIGTGIGLALTKELIHLHHGTIEAASQPGQGTEFIILLPKNEDYYKSDIITSESAVPKISTTAEEEPLLEETAYENIIQDYSEFQKDNLLTVLIVEDNVDVRKYLRECLQDEYRIIESENGLVGFQQAVTEVPDLIVSDVMMPVIDGFELAKKIKEDIHTSHIPIVLLTAKGDEESRLEGLELGVDDYLTKPFNRKELIIRINNLIAIRRKLQEKYQHYLQIEPSAIQVKSVDERFIKHAFEIVEANLEDPTFDIEKFSKSLAVSRAQLYRKLKSIINKSPNDLIRLFRLKRAAQLLKSKSGNVTEIAYQVGFNNLSYFAKCFKEEYGVLPSDYK